MQAVLTDKELRRQLNLLVIDLAELKVPEAILCGHKSSSGMTTDHKDGASIGIAAATFFVQSRVDQILAGLANGGT